MATFIPDDIWKIASHNASAHGTNLLREFLPDRQFPFPKSLYAVEDCLRFFAANKPNATIVDFFSGSGTTAHAVMRLNRQDGGLRQSISITNNELEFDEAKGLIESGLRPGDSDWEARGICQFITKPRIQAAITGVTSTGVEIPGDYRFTDEFPKKEGFEQNVEFFDLTYENPLEVEADRNFIKIAPILWLQAGAVGDRIENVAEGWRVAQRYGVLKDLDKTSHFVAEANSNLSCRIAFIFTDMDRVFESIAQALAAHIQPVRMPELYFRNFETEVMAVTR
jgi:adenine-specific DNA-methyltransferase